MRQFAFSKKIRLAEPKSIKKAFKQRSFYKDGLKLFVARNHLEYNRYLFTFRRNFATAVKRNRIRRICRELLRHLNLRLQQGNDVVFLFTDSTIDVSVSKNLILTLLEKAELLASENFNFI